MKKIIVTLALPVAICLAVFFAAKPPVPHRASDDATSLTLMSWNVENLFDTQNDPDTTGDDEFTPEVWRYWTDERYQMKLMHLADIIALADADFVALQEVENRRVLDDLTEVLRRSFGRDYPTIVHREGPDHRGIDVALLAVYPPVETNWFTPVPGQRDVLEATFAPHGIPLTLFVNHCKSRWEGQAETAPLRMTQTVAVRRVIDRRLSENAGAAMVVMGDFNDNFDEPSLAEGLRSVSAREALAEEAAGGSLVNLHAGLPADQRGTLFFNREQVWNSFDSMHVTAGMLDSATAGWKVTAGSYGVLRDARLLDAQGHPKPFRLVYNRETRKHFYQYGYSDHLPIRVRLRLEPPDLRRRADIAP